MPLWREVLWPDVIEWIRLPLVVFALAGLIGLGEVLRRLTHLAPEYSRKFVHIAVGAALLLAPRLFISPIPLLILSVIFALINGVAIKAGWLKGIHGPARRSLGTVYFPVSLFLLTLFLWHRSPDVVVLSMFVFSMGDAAAAIVGESLKKPTVYTMSGDPKSVEGSLAMFLVTGLSTIGGLWYLAPHMIASWEFILVMSGAAAVLGTLWEALSSKGFDNLTVPLSHGFVFSLFLLPTTGISLQQFSMGISLGLLVGVTAYLVRALSLSGSAATTILAAIIFGIGGWKWAMPIVVFFVFSSALSFAGRTLKSDLESVFEKSSTRDHGQVAANGGVAGLLALLSFAVPGVDWYPAYIGAIAAVTADTWGTEFGIMFRGRTVSLIGFREVARGSNGGVSLAGSAAAVAGATLIGAIGGQWTGEAATVVVGLFAGVAGASVDSLVGESLQARFRCFVCQKETERTSHCGQATDRVGGLRWLRNDGVNWACAVAGACVAYVLAIR